MRSTTDAIGWAEVVNRLRFSDKAIVRSPADFLPWLKTEAERNTQLVITDQTKAIALRLQKEGRLPLRVETLLYQIEVLPRGK